MTDSPRTDPTAESDSPQIPVLVVVEDSADCRLLREWLAESDEFTPRVVGADDPAPFDAAFDVCLFDVDGLRGVAGALAAHRKSTSTYTPTLLFVPERYGDAETVLGRLGDAGDHVDDVIDAPIRRANLARRLRTLARARRFSTRLEQSRDRHQRLVRRLPDAVFVCADGRVTYANPAAASLLGVDPAAVRTAEFVDLVPEVDRDSVARALETAAAGGRSEPIETALHRTVIRNADGGTERAGPASSSPEPADAGTPEGTDVATDAAAGRPASTEADAVNDSVPEPLIDSPSEPASRIPVELTAIDGGSGDVQVVVHDLRQRREREERLALYRRAMDEATVGITIADHSTEEEGLIYANEEFKRLTGLGDDDLLGHNPRILQTDATNPGTVAQLRRAIDRGEEASVVLLNRRSDGRRWYSALDISPIRGADGDVTHYLGFQRDVTERVSHEQRLSVLDRVLRHNIRNRLNVVLGYADRAQRVAESADSTDDSLVVDLDDLRGALDRIREAATDILDLSDSARRFREDVGADGDDDPVDAGTVVVDVASALAAAAPDATVLVSTPDGPATVAGAGALSLVVDELVSNALEHVEDPTVHVSLSVAADEAVLRVADDGSGITPDSRAPLDSGAETPTEHGQGVGLWLVRWTVDAVGGTVGYEEGSDGGAVVIARIPIVNGDAAA
ncbi:PAS domain-containing sensor histidine kinase [Halobaculum gomorrense]|uniref:histidine kinase n=1 Tax=Halobaculum gomorrense TaxID=43928 RepID=A0A1M5K1N1_9EURY|nr:PAS domain-containing sensor histidine kinase [Halobaculum gomorrense]SHG46687.1 PAS domain S-box-containing protein [Halobaculum gomorrense]